MQTSPLLTTPAPADMPAAIAAAKRELRSRLGDPATAFAVSTTAMSDAVAAVVAERVAAGPGGSVVPVVEFADIAAATVPAATIDAIARRGCAVVRRTFPRTLAERWNDEIGDYLERNEFERRYRGPADEVFGNLASKRPQIYGIYWSRPQVEARQHPNMAATRAFLNSFWKHESEGRVWFDPNRDTAYPDRLRRREPGSSSRGLSPHTDSGSVERWLLPAYQRVFRHVFDGDWDAYDPWDGAHRSEVHEYPSTVMCSAFRSFQGWTALSDMQPSDGVLHVIPIPRAMGYLLLRALQDDVAPDDLCGAANGRVLALTDEHHRALIDAYSPIPAVEPGDTVWWHGDLVHGVGDVSNQERWGNVMYIPATPWCEKNATYAATCGEAFLAGQSPGDFAAEDYEVDFDGRATIADLTPAGRVQLGLDDADDRA